MGIGGCWAMGPFIAADGFIPAFEAVAIGVIIVLSILDDGEVDAATCSTMAMPDTTSFNRQRRSVYIRRQWSKLSFNGRSVYQESRANASFAEPRSLVSRPDEQRSNLPCRRRMIRAARSNMREICVSMTEANVEGRRRDEDRRRDELVNTIVEGRNLANLYMVERQWTGWRTSQRTMG